MSDDHGKEVRCLKDEVHRLKEEVQHSKEEVQHSKEEVQRSKDEVQRSKDDHNREKFMMTMTMQQPRSACNHFLKRCCIQIFASSYFTFCTCITIRVFIL